jgi:hypothetical protein
MAKDPTETLALMEAGADADTGVRFSFRREVSRSSDVAEREELRPAVMAFLAGTNAESEDDLETMIALLRAGFELPEREPS